MTQYLLIKGLKKFNKVGEAAVKKDLNKLYTNITFFPMDIEKKIRQHKEYVLASLLFSKQKRGGSIKG